MTGSDLLKLKEVLESIRLSNIVGAGNRVAIHSAWPEQVDAMREVFGEDVVLLNKEDWNIMEGRFKEKFDLLVFCNVFMYVNQPKLAFKNVLKSCRYLLIQDLIKRDRGQRIFGHDGDCMRYRYGRWKSNYRKAFDIGKAGHVSAFFPYADDHVNLHFVALIEK